MTVATGCVTFSNLLLSYI